MSSHTFQTENRRRRAAVGGLFQPDSSEGAAAPVAGSEKASVNSSMITAGKMRDGNAALVPPLDAAALPEGQYMQ